MPCADYYDLLNRVRLEGDWEEWLTFYADWKYWPKGPESDLRRSGADYSRPPGFSFLGPLSPSSAVSGMRCWDKAP